MEVKISEQLVNDTQRYHIECDGLAYLLSYMVKNGVDVNLDMYKNYEAKYFEAFQMFEHSKGDVEQEVRQVVPNVTSWSLDYNTGMAKVETS